MKTIVFLHCIAEPKPTETDSIIATVNKTSDIQCFLSPSASNVLKYKKYFNIGIRDSQVPKWSSAHLPATRGATPLPRTCSDDFRRLNQTSRNLRQRFLQALAVILVPVCKCETSTQIYLFDWLFDRRSKPHSATQTLPQRHVQRFPETPPEAPPKLIRNLCYHLLLFSIFYYCFTLFYYFLLCFTIF